MMHRKHSLADRSWVGLRIGPAFVIGLAACASARFEDVDGVQNDLANGSYNFGALASPGKCLDVDQAASADGTNVQQWTCNGTAAQSWRVEDQAGGAARLVNPSSNKCLDVSGAGTADGTN